MIVSCWAIILSLFTKNGVCEQNVCLNLLSHNRFDHSRWCFSAPISSAWQQYVTFFNSKAKCHSQKWIVVAIRTRPEANKKTNVLIEDNLHGVCRCHAWNPSTHHSAPSHSLELKRHAEHHHAQCSLISVIDMCLLACRLDLETTCYSSFCRM